VGGCQRRPEEFGGPLQGGHVGVGQPADQVRDHPYPGRPAAFEQFPARVGGGDEHDAPVALGSGTGGEARGFKRGDRLGDRGRAYLLDLGEPAQWHRPTEHQDRQGGRAWPVEVHLGVGRTRAAQQAQGRRVDRVGRPRGRVVGQPGGRGRQPLPRILNHGYPFTKVKDRGSNGCRPTRPGSCERH
jgi:hypothetical protein